MAYILITKIATISVLKNVTRTRFPDPLPIFENSVKTGPSHQKPTTLNGSGNITHLGNSATYLSMPRRLDDVTH